MKNKNKKILEDVTNGVAGGNIAGLGIGNPHIANQAEPGKKPLRKILRRKQQEK